MPGSCLPSLSGPPKRKRYGRKFKKRAAELAAAAAAVFGSVDSPSSLSAAGLASSLKPAAIASTAGGNSAKNCIEFRNLG